MKQLFSKLSITCLLLLVSIYSYSKESLPTYYISKTSINKTLLKTEAVFAFNFSASNHLLVKQNILLSYNGTNKTVKVDEKGNVSIKLKPGKYLFRFFYNKEHFEIVTDTIHIKPAFQTDVIVNFESSIYPVIADKPVIYVYPKQTKKINITLDLKGNFNFTYPSYINDWDFIADSNGTIHMNDREYHYLFWDGILNLKADKINWNEGFVVNKNNLVSFFEDKLTKMGLNSKEIDDYITYWCPMMMVNENNYIHFIFNKDYDTYATLKVEPKPDVMFRVFMVWSKTDTKNASQIKEQPLESFKRFGFSLVEWGGAETTRFEYNRL